ncbi:hypothetical protein PROVRETT_07059 [Providencia rettgeri DSM 1131]|nr:hypothetical protein PROVRETT_07059 [Providencia rettgeri DSM 1131]
MKFISNFNWVYRFSYFFFDLSMVIPFSVLLKQITKSNQLNRWGWLWVNN